MDNKLINSMATTNKTLYIIGNGFDLHHDLDTKYQSFGMFLKEKHSQIYDNLIEYYILPTLDPDDDDSYYDPLWSDFENALANLDFESILDDNTDSLPDIASDDFRDRDLHTYQQVMEQFVDDFTENLYKVFKEFILNVKFPDDISDKKLKVKTDAIFLNFNYTNTLEKYYDIKGSQILYIHNRAISGEILILGHGTDPNDFIPKAPTPPEGLSKEELYEWEQRIVEDYDYSYDSGKEELLTYFKKSHKSTKEIINSNYNFFSKLSGIENIFVIGHSLSNVDKSYFVKIVDSINNQNANWTVSYYNPKDIKDRKQKLIEFGLKEHQVNLVSMKSLLTNR